MFSSIRVDSIVKKKKIQYNTDRAGNKTQSKHTGRPQSHWALTSMFGKAYFNAMPTRTSAQEIEQQYLLLQEATSAPLEWSQTFEVNIPVTVPQKHISPHTTSCTVYEQVFQGCIPHLSPQSCSMYFHRKAKPQMCCRCPFNPPLNQSKIITADTINNTGNFEGNYCHFKIKRSKVFFITGILKSKKTVIPSETII